jgi:hypothetical protein
MKPMTKKDQRYAKVMTVMTEAAISLLKKGYTPREISDHMSDNSCMLKDAEKFLRLGLIPTPAAIFYLYTTNPNAKNDARLAKLAKRRKK